MTIQAIITNILKAEGSEYTDHPNDLGGPTKYGITLQTLRKFYGDSRLTEHDVMDLREEEVIRIYTRLYVEDPGFDKVAVISEAVAAELVDTGVNMGVETATRFLQRALNAFNSEAKFYPDLEVDGRIGRVTLSALACYLTFRNESVLVKALNCLQGARYIELAEKREKNETFVYGWLKERVKL